MVFLRPLKADDHFPGLTGPESGFLYYVALEGERLAGFCRYRRKAEEIELLELSDGGDLELADGLLRAVLAAAADSGIDRAALSEEVAARLVPLKLPLSSENILKSIEIFLYSCKNCEKSKRVL